jgi:hypothetical protein
MKPLVTTSYRLAWGTIRAGLAKVSVAARVATTASAGGVHGTERPVVASSPVDLQQQQPDGSWATVTSTVADAAGSWAFSGVAAGTYRVRSTPGSGIVAGLSAPFTVA